jgi:hypothetical protein
MKDLRERAVKGTLARVCAQSANLLLHLVAVLTGVLNQVRDFGLSAASVQHARVTEEQTSTLFWINLLVGVLLASVASGLAPVVAAFYHEPRLYWVTIIMASSFVFNAAGIQHSARLQRQMRFTTLSVIDTGSWIVSTIVAIGAAIACCGYWAFGRNDGHTSTRCHDGFWVVTDSLWDCLIGPKVPVVVWSVEGSVISLRDVLITLGRPLAASSIAAAAAFGCCLVAGSSHLTRLCRKSRTNQHLSRYNFICYGSESILCRSSAEDSFAGLLSKKQPSFRLNRVAIR